jgi:general secretion pathway protein H
MARRAGLAKMPISAIGNNPASHAAPKVSPRVSPRGEAGFTLVELMVVMVIIGLMAAAVVGTLPDSHSHLRDETESLAARLVAARDLSIVTGRDIGVRVDAHGYAFDTRSRSGWQPVDAKALASHQWPAGVSALVAIEGGAGLIFDATGLATPATIALRQDGSEALVTVDSAGVVQINGQ